jgi:hypothetical protein
LMASYGWQLVNLACLPLLAVAGFALWPRRVVGPAIPLQHGNGNMRLPQPLSAARRNRAGR